MHLDPHELGADELDSAYHAYRDLVPVGDVLAFLTEQRERVLDSLASLPQATQRARYAPGKWSLAEVLGHVVDMERVFSYRAALVARGVRDPMIGVDENALVAGADFDGRDWKDLLDEFAALRQAGLLLLRSFDEPVLARRGTASGRPFSTRSLICVLAGHAEHHLRVMQQRYLG